MNQEWWLGTQTLANAVARFGHNIKRFIHVSTSEVYGNAAADVMDEDHPLNPMSPYASAKCGADRLIYSYWATYNIPVVIVRPFNNFGPMQHLEKLVPRFVTSAMLDEPLTVMPVAPIPAPQPGPDAPPAPIHNGPAYWIKVSAQPDGAFTVTNGRNGFSKTYSARP